MNIYIGNLSQQATEEDLSTAFAAYGNVKSVNLLKDKFSGASKGFAFVEIESKTEAQAAIKGLDGSELKGTRIIVNEARPKSENRRGGGGRRW
jgi:RNA recognition motif-containing protein